MSQNGDGCHAKERPCLSFDADRSQRVTQSNAKFTDANPVGPLPDNYDAKQTKSPAATNMPAGPKMWAKTDVPVVGFE